jgi:hypothetical protein
MAKKKKKRGKGPAAAPKGRGWAQAMQTKGELDRKRLGFLVLAIGGGTLAANAMGNNPYAFLFSLATTAGGLYTKNLYLTAAGGAMMLTTAPSYKNAPVAPADEVNGLSLDNFKSGAKERIGSFFNTFKEKFKLPDSANAPVNGLGNVYTNPLAASIGMNQLNELERQLDQMNGMSDEDLNDLPNREL